ncbi:MAG TPA: hypothetical protein VHZ99_12075 [Steroidobacteraceae bacterium]|jgi:hypothetical protein|nr:hypothetical protein [Steroidobacteraceae bacterium]
MEWLLTHWTSLLGIAVLGWVADQILAFLTTIRRDRPDEIRVLNLLDMTVFRRP